MRSPTALHIDLTCCAFERKPIHPMFVQRTIGGRGINMAHLLATLDAQVPALDPRTPLLFAAGLHDSTA